LFEFATLVELIMPLRPVFDLDLLRTLLFVSEEASFTRAAERVGRTQSAVTLQVQKLEAAVGHPLLIRSKGGPVELSPYGRALVDHARAMLKLNDEAFEALCYGQVPVSLRMGVGTYFTPMYLDRTLEAMRAIHPHVLVEVIQGISCQLVPQLRDGEFDLLVSDIEPPDWPGKEVWRGALRWITSANEEIHLRNPLPLSLYPTCPWRPPWMKDCLWRSAPLHALRQAGRAHSIALVSNTMEGNFEAVREGKAVTVSPDLMLPAGVRAVAEHEGLPPLPDTRIVILKGQNATQPLTDKLADVVLASWSEPELPETRANEAIRV
jgi:DNA-binding transcriptional LysR family regulator